MGKFITIVSGLPRTGTSMMMKMLAAGGMEVVSDNIRKADEDNPEGYFEYERVKEIKKDSSWLAGMAGKAFKMVSMLLYELPEGLEYRVIFMERDITEMLASQKKMLVRLGRDTGQEDDERSRQLYEGHLARIKEWLKGRKDVEILYVNYNELLKDPYAHAHAVAEFLGGGMDPDRMVAMVNPDLYRNRAAGPVKHV